MSVHLLNQRPATNDLSALCDPVLAAGRWQSIDSSANTML